MAIFTRTAGDAQGVNNFDATTDGTLDTIIATGLTKSPTALKITSIGTLAASDSNTGGVVEGILKQIAVDSTIVMYQVSSTQMSVLVEATGAPAGAIQTRIRTVAAQTANAVVATSQGIKFA
jgi:hypothetical protein